MQQFGPDVKTREPLLSAGEQQATGHLQTPQPLLICLLDGLWAGIISMELGSLGRYMFLYHL